MKTIELLKETNEVQRVLTLRNSRNSRHRYREFIIEGRQAIDQAFACGWTVKSLFYNKDLALSNWAKHHLNQKKYATSYALSSALMEKIADKSDPSELIGIAQMQMKHFSDYQPTLQDVVVVMDEPKSAGNLGMMIRSCVAFGVSACVISGHAADEYDPKCIRASVGTFFSFPLYKVEGIRKFTDTLNELKSVTDVKIIASGDKGDVLLEESHFTDRPLFLVLGNETSGISAGYKELAHEFVRISLPGKFTSLNIAAAGSIFLYEIFKNRPKQKGS